MKLHPIVSLAAILNLATLTAQAAPDVAVIGKPVISQSPYYAGGPLTVTYTVKNVGDQPAAASKTKIQIYTPVGTQFATEDFAVAALAAGAQRTESHTLTTINTNAWSGTWQVGVRLDTQFEITGEFPTTNNVSERADFKLIATKWDLKFNNDEKPGPCPTNNAYGGIVRFAFIIHNDSSTPSPVTRTRIQIFDRTHTSVLNEQVLTPPIPAYGKVPFVYAYQLPATGTPGGWSSFVHLNDQGIFTEASGFNNASDEVTIQVAAPGSTVGTCPITPGLMNPRAAGNDLVFDVWGHAGTSLNIQTSTDLINWSNLTSHSVVNGVNTFTTPKNGVKRYYRIK